MYINPDTVVYIMRGVPLDSTYDHSIIFRSKNEQFNYFFNETSGFKKFTLTGQMYQRVLGRNAIRVSLPYNYDVTPASPNRIGALYDCNYIAFENTEYSNKIFYAFIDTVEFINNEVCEIRYTIDVLQTWMFDYELEECFVEREHSASDNIGEHTVPENLELGEYEYELIEPTIAGVEQGAVNTIQWNDMCVIIAATFRIYFDPIHLEFTYRDAKGIRIGNMYTGLYFNRFNIDNDGDVRWFNLAIQNISSQYKSDGVVSIFMCPKQFVANIPAVTDLTTDADTIAVPYYHIQLPKNIDYNYPDGTQNGYVPKNKKLYTYPYNLLAITDNNGKEASYRYEFFVAATNCTFDVKGAISCSPEFSVTPTGYNGLSENIPARLITSSLPQCAYSTDTFKAWLAQNSGRFLSEGIKTGATLAAGAKGLIELKPETMIGSAISEISSIVGEAYQASILPNQAHGSGTNSLNVATGTYGFKFYHARIRLEYAKIIDDYFSRFGYACHRNKIPNRDVRNAWCYTKTIGCTIRGEPGVGIPNDEFQKICSIYNNGITWWQPNVTIGDYTQDNSPKAAG